MSEDLINRYKQSYRIQFQDDELESRYRETQAKDGQASSMLDFGVLLLLCLAFAFLEYRAFGIDVPIPMYGYLLAAAAALGNLLISKFSDDPQHLQFRLVANGVFTMGVVIGAVFLQKYSAYHVIEFVLLVAWLGSQRQMRTVVSFSLNLLLAIVFVGVMSVTDISGFWVSLVSILLIAAVLLGGYLGYVSERARRLLFLQTESNGNVNRRQEMWAFTLIDLDLALSGIVDFKELIGLLKKHLEPVIEFDSYVLTSLEGQGPKPVADEAEGELFDTEKTLWSEDLLGKLNQTRQATASAEHEIVKGFLGMERQRFISYRLDVPIFNDTRLMGVISLRRESAPYDNLDKIASASIAAQAMMIYRRSKRAREMAAEKASFASPAPPKPAPMKPVAPKPEISKPEISKPEISKPVTPVSAPERGVTESVIRARPDDDQSLPPPMSTTEEQDMEMTDHTFSGSDQTLVPKEVITQFKKNQETAKKTITLMSRENADKIAVDRYRTAAVEGAPLSVLIIEVDGLSKLREEDGDEVAYKVFAAIVKYIFTRVDKEKDILGRYGQNGLSVLMPQVDMNAAERFAESIRQFVAGARYKTAYGEKTATLSIGVAAITDDTGDYPSMIKRADMALFVAKKNGRNCVKVRL